MVFRPLVSLETSSDLPSAEVEPLQIADGTNGVVVHDNPDSGQIVLDGSRDRMGHHHEAAVTAHGDTRGLRSRQFRSQNATDTKAHGGKSAGSKVGARLFGGPVLLNPWLVVPHVREHDGIFRCSLTDVVDHSSGVDGAIVASLVRRHKVFPFLLVAAELLEPPIIVA